MQQLGSNGEADIGDFAKMFAVATVMTQSVISFLMTDRLPVGQQFFLGGIYETIKFSASAFIFGILFSTIRTHPDASWKDYPRFMRNRWHILFVPSILWTVTYLLLVPQLQQHRYYHNLATFCWQFINGNAAPHLWYNVMMLQFIILMPFFWALARWINGSRRRALAAGILALVFEFIWNCVYASRIFHGPEQTSWYMFDRIFPSFIVFAVCGTILWQCYPAITEFLQRHWLTQILVWLALLYYVTLNFFGYGLPVRLTNAPYYLPSMIFYNLATIGLIATFALYMQRFCNQWLPLVHWIALYAHRAYLSHVFWLYWCWRLTTGWHLPLVIWFPLLIFLTILLAFCSAYSFHRIWVKIKDLLGIHRHLANG
ncbi:acyltransferase family protein [Limosilactobacillus sp.]|uniref:acyltransferase family protein n=1 Tax=Limosilactobacillus sp. TaxID=2773925 RepID=UPI0025BB66BD|nr:acyltransferase family protein [Limosilactobacillus sp.]MCH3921471.1 acyltransferase [Limosilactobacillus sp.]MCH3928242.1 acyltransferase [Limosilactobacillus sp.]